MEPGGAFLKWTPQSSVGVPRFYLTPLRNVCTISSMEPQHTITVEGSTPLDGYHRVITSNDPLPSIYSELTGPESAFTFRERVGYDIVKVVSPELVTISIFQTL